jgi:uncharacterized membrane protein
MHVWSGLALILGSVAMVVPVVTIVVRRRWDMSNLQAVISEESSLVTVVVVGMGVCLPPSWQALSGASDRPTCRTRLA